MSSQPSIIIVGAGMAGLTCAVYLKKRGIDALILEASDGVGGRVRTDVINGFRLDRGFQILLTAYPEARRLLDYTALDLKPFRSGALIHYHDHQGPAQWMPFVNPLREPIAIAQTMVSPVGTLSDKLRVVELMRRVSGIPTNDFFLQQATDTETFLESFGYSSQMIERFFRPFFGGIFLEDELRTSSNFFEFCFQNFYSGDAAVPALGMEAIPQQLANQLSPTQIRLNTPVERISENTVFLKNGESLRADSLVLAVDAHAAARLLNPSGPAPAFNHTTCTYFSAPQSPRPNKLLMLNTNRKSAVHNMCVISDVAPAYAPTGQALISVSTQGLDVVNEVALADRIRKELTDWFGEEVKSWKWLRTYHLPEALPQFNPGQPGVSMAQLKLSERLYQCGDQTAYPSLNAAMQTGRLVAELLAE